MEKVQQLRPIVKLLGINNLKIIVIGFSLELLRYDRAVLAVFPYAAKYTKVKKTSCSITQRYLTELFR